MVKNGRTRFLKYVWPFFNITHEKVNVRYLRILIQYHCQRHTNADWKICQYLRLRMKSKKKKKAEDFTLKYLLHFEILHT